MPFKKIPLKKIKMNGAGRKDMGDVAPLAQSMASIGLLHPLVVNRENTIVAGRRRLAAAKVLGWKDITCNVVASFDETLAALQAERDENSYREPLKGSEIAELGMQLEKAEAEEAKKRIQAGKQAESDPVESIPQGTLNGDSTTTTGKTRDAVGSALGVSGKTFEHAKQIKQAAADNPALYGDLVQMMDDKTIGTAFKELKRRQRKMTPKSERKKAKEKKPKEKKPDPVPDVGKLFCQTVEDTCREIDQLVQRVDAFKASPFAYGMLLDSIVTRLKDARAALWKGRPNHVCPYCKGKKDDTECRACRDTGRVRDTAFKSGKAAVGE